MTYYDYVEALDSSKRSINELVELYSLYPQNDQLGTHAKNILNDLYRQTAKILDLKKQEEGSLTSEEETIYKKCQEQLSDKKLKGIFRIINWTIVSNIINAYECIYHMLPCGKEEGKVQKLLFHKGQEVLPNYIGFMTTLIDTYETFCMPDTLLLPANMYDAAKRGNANYRVIEADDNKAFGAQMLHVADFAYHGKSEFEGYIPLSKQSLPESLRSMYQETNGLFSSGHGLRVWLAKKDNLIALSYSGTDPMNPIMDYEDFVQIYSASALYLEAAGFLRILLNAFPTYSFVVCGHSLGGGLAQFSTCANIEGNETRLKCYAYNPAGLSCVSLDHLKDIRIKKAMHNIWIYVTTGDMVSLSGAKIGRIITLPACESNGHGMKSLYKCMDAYLKKETVLKGNRILDMVYYTCASQKLPSWKTSYVEGLDGDNKYHIFTKQIQDKTKLKDIQIYQYILQNVIANDKQNDRFEVFENFNGDGFTVLNRLLLFDRGLKSLELTRESAASIVFFGPYGHDKKYWFKAILDIIGSDESPIDRSSFDMYFSRIQDEQEIMLSAWLYILNKVYGVDLYAAFEKEVAKTRAYALLKEYMNQSQALCHQYGYHREPLKEEYTLYIEKKYEVFKKFLETAGSLAVTYQLMNDTQKTSIIQDILKYLRIFIASMA